MKPREPRLTCVIKARVRLDNAWGDVCIRNISSRGMLIQGASAPPRGTYIEVYRGRHVIVARVAWSKEQTFGIQTQERLNVNSVLAEPDRSGIDYQKRLKSQPGFERRSPSRPTEADLRWRAERSRFRSKALEFACIGTIGVSAALILFGTVSDVLINPMAVVSAELAK